MITRIRQLLDWQQLSPTQFADLIGVGRPVVSHILSERNKPSLEVVQRIIAAFPVVSLPWLLNGIGEMLAEAPATVASRPAPAPSISIAPLPPTPKAAAMAAAEATPSAAPVAVAPGVVPAPVAAVARPVAAPKPALARFKVSKATTDLPAIPTAAPPLPPTTLNELPPAAAPAVNSVPLADPLVGSELAPPSSLPELAAAPLPAPTDALPPAGPSAPALFPLLGEPGKAIRRIVIFYRDGSFADYQPEE